MICQRSHRNPVNGVVGVSWKVQSKLDAFYCVLEGQGDAQSGKKQGMRATSVQREDVPPHTFSYPRALPSLTREPRHTPRSHFPRQFVAARLHLSLTYVLTLLERDNAKEGLGIRAEEPRGPFSSVQDYDQQKLPRPTHTACVF